MARPRGPELRYGQKLTDLERAILPLVANGLSNADVGKELFRHESTIKWHMKRLQVKLGAVNRVQMAALAVARGHVRPGQLRPSTEIKVRVPAEEPVSEVQS